MSRYTKTLAIAILAGLVLVAADTPPKAKPTTATNELLPPPREVRDEGASRFRNFSEAFLPDDETMAKSPVSNRVSLKIQCLRNTDDFQDEFIMNYKISYSGKRKPLVIVRPSIYINRGTAEETVIRNFVVGKSGEVYAFSISNVATLPNPLGLNHKKSDFATSDAGQDGIDGQLKIQMAEIKKYLIEANSNEFLSLKSITMISQLRLNIIDRGSDYNLDAWTGRAESNYTRTEIVNW